MSNKYARLSDAAVLARYLAAAKRNDYDEGEKLVAEMRRRKMPIPPFETRDDVTIQIGNSDRFVDVLLATHAAIHLLMHSASGRVPIEELLPQLVGLRVMAVELEMTMLDTINASGVAHAVDTKLREAWKAMDDALRTAHVSASESDKLIADLVNATRGLHAKPDDEMLANAIATWELLQETLDADGIDLEKFGPGDINPNLN